MVPRFVTPYPILDVMAKADNFDTGCIFSEEKFCAGFNRSAAVQSFCAGVFQ